MKKAITAILILASSACYSQIYQPPLLFGKTENRSHSLISMGVPNDTFSVVESKKGYPHIAFKDTVLYRFDTLLKKWTKFQPGGSAASGENIYNANGLLTSNRTLKGGNTYSLTLDSINGFSVKMSTGSAFNLKFGSSEYMAVGPGGTYITNPAATGQSISLGLNPGIVQLINSPFEIRVYPDTVVFGSTTFAVPTYHKFYRSGQTYFGGNVGIGTTTPAFTLDVNGKYGIAGKQLAYLPSAFTGSFALGSGLQQLVHNSGAEGYGNQSFGYMSGDSITTGFLNTTLGYNSANSLRTGFYNTVLGVNAGALGKYYTENVYIGLNAAYRNKGNYNTVIGTTGLYNCDSCETMVVIGNLAAFQARYAKQITAIGYRVLNNFDSGYFNDAIGYRNMESLVRGDANVSHGNHGLSVMTSGSFNTGIGFYAGNSLSTGRHNSFFGAYSGNHGSQKTNAVSSTAIGAYSYTTRDYETSIGSDSTKYLRLKATDSLQADLVRTTSYGWVWAFDSATKNTRYMPTSSISGGGGGSGVTTVGTFSGSSQTNGASISGSTITFGPADATNPGMVTTGTQTFAGAKTFSSNAVINGMTAGTYGGDQGFQVTNSKSLYFVTNGTLLNFEAGSAKLQVQIAGAGAYTQGSLVYGGNTGYWRMGSNMQILGSAGYTSLGAAGTADQLVVASGGNVGVGTTSPSTYLDINGNKFRIRTAKTPSSATDTGSQGDICWDADYIYICTATNTWKRVAVSTW